ncbi:hypothetical protein [Streptomyces sp. NPDC059759]|uniref:hypothetical protein n=1 Tax=Streptomyces sp. NPDC059759 TaxID=3346936 RepID=UPI00364E4846
MGIDCADGRAGESRKPALLGAAYSAEDLPVGLVSRHELAWVLDTQARDLTTQLADHPSGAVGAPSPRTTLP